MPGTSKDSAFLPARAKLWIGSLDDPALQVRAQYNPKELQIDKQINWGEHGEPAAPGADDGSKQSDLELKGAPTRSMTIELLFDAYEEPGASVEADVRVLEKLSSIQDPKSDVPERRRPHHCVVAWGATGDDKMRPFRCVIESLSTKYMMWDRAGTPVRATCTVKLKEAYRMAPGLIPEESYGERQRPRR
jgi:hypothetical protein